MANYRTIVPGMNEDPDQARTIYQSDQQSNYRAAVHSGTIIPGMEESIQVNEPKAQVINTQKQVTGNKPLVGFLVSVSKSVKGEYWVLQLGQNSIGASADCDIQLSEASVSGLHAVLAIHRNPQNDNKLSIGIMDKGSSNGVFVNEEYIGFNPHQCNNMDKIKIGNYEFILLIFDSVEYGLKQAETFIETAGVNIKSENSSYDSRENYPNILGEGTQP